MKSLRFWLGIIVSIICLALAVRDVNFAEVLDALGGANYAFVALTSLLTVAGMLMRALRWRLLFYPLNDVPLNKLVTVLNIGYLLMNVLPARLGDVARAYLLGELTGVSKARALSTIVVERVADVLVVVLLLSSLVLFIPLPDWAVQSGLLLGAGFLALAVVLVLFARYREAGIALIRNLVGRVRCARPGGCLAPGGLADGRAGDPAASGTGRPAAWRARSSSGSLARSSSTPECWPLTCSFRWPPPSLSCASPRWA